MNTLMVSQTIFYIISSVAILALGILLSFAAYHLVRILKDTRDISNDLSHAYKRTKKKIISLISPKNDKE